MAIEIACELSTVKLKRLVNSFEQQGFVPISMSSEPVGQLGDHYKCILMYRNEY